MLHLLKALTDIIFPPHIDVTVARGINELTILGRVSVHHDKEQSIYTSLPYSDPSVRALIRANKFQNDIHSARVLGSALGETLSQVLNEYTLDSAWDTPLLVPIPLSQKRRRLRGFNQVERIIKYTPDEVVGYMRYDRTSLKRHERQSQTRVPKEERENNIQGAFFVSKNNHIAGESIFLIDDVSESGATMRDAIGALMEAGARNVIGIALAR